MPSLASVYPWLAFQTSSHVEGGVIPRGAQGAGKRVVWIEMSAVDCRAEDMTLEFQLCGEIRLAVAHDVSDLGSPKRRRSGRLIEPADRLTHERRGVVVGPCAVVDYDGLERSVRQYNPVDDN